MQAIHLSHKLIWKELQMLGCSSTDADQFIRHNLNYFFKLRGIPEPAMPFLKKEALAHLTGAVFSHETGRTGPGAEAVISGSESELTALGHALIAQGGAAAVVGQILQDSLSKLYLQLPQGLKLGEHLLPLGKRTLVMGILNVTPDSFSDGGRFSQLEEALTQGYKLAKEGADILDIGGESTRPGSQQVPAEVELKRIMPVIAALKKDRSFKIPLSVDTYKAEVAEKALAAGVEMLNDVWGFKENATISQVVSRYRVPVCLMHNRRSTDYNDLIPDILEELEESIELAHRAGIDDSHIIIDPGIGFGKTLEQNLDVMLHLQEIRNLGYPLLLGTSRKSMIGKTLALPAEERLEGTAATIAYGISAGADIIRVHDVLQMRRVAVMTDAMIRR